MLALVGFCPAARNACTNVYASAMPYSTLPSHGSEGAYWALMLLKRVTQGLEASVSRGRYVSLMVPAISAAGRALPRDPPVRIVESVGGSDPTLLTTNWG